MIAKYIELEMLNFRRTDLRAFDCTPLPSDPIVQVETRNTYGEMRVQTKTSPLVRVRFQASGVRGYSGGHQTGDSGW